MRLCSSPRWPSRTSKPLPTTSPLATHVRAVSFVRELRAAVPTHCTLNPPGYRMRAGARTTASDPAPHGHYVIFFEATAHAVTRSIRVLHGARDLPALFRPDDEAS
jgi:toxin ParE1/3/4